jgi:hypothetical protein
LKKHLVNVLAVVGLTGSAMLGSTGSAEAATPMCVSTSSWNSGIWNYAKATNNCSNNQRFYFRWDRAVDGPCSTYGPGGWREEGRLYQARFAGLSDC